jgi:hypothetical protein
MLSEINGAEIGERRRTGEKAVGEGSILQEIVDGNVEGPERARNSEICSSWRE